MKLSQTALIDKIEIGSICFDCFICSSGFEERSTFIAKQVGVNSKLKVALCFNNYLNDDYRKKNDAYFEKNEYHFLFEDGDQAISLIKLLNEITELEQESINIAIDYSSMTRIWYSAIVSYFNQVCSKKTVNVYFFYSFSKFSIPTNGDIRNIHIGPLENFSTLSIPDKPTALIIGLGYERERAFGLTEYFDAETFLFYADKSRDNQYYKAVKAANNNIMDQVKKENIFEYSLLYLDNTESLLYSVCKSLKNDYRLVLAPTGPKPFTLLCLLTSIRLKNIDVWRISAGKISQPTRKEPDGTWNCYRATFVSD